MVQTPLSGVFSVENAGESWETLQRAVDRIVTIIKTDPNKERIDKVITRWIKRHLQRLGAEVNLEQLNSLVEDKDMLAENLENLVQKSVGLVSNWVLKRTSRSREACFGKQTQRGL
ncbi:hypothetical protein HORIV_46940 [Vreelandella olivaria]|uniref:Uncharacterized protein n=1 Tax=Vreelandella olivaria TaxID=390919 RepID=A0ABM7GKD3_9GAMM|nr:hypothetical protein HORIV_46940 [Halomonas olivaria]